MRIEDILAPDRVVHGLRAGGKAACLDAMSRRAARALGLDAGVILAALLRREALGSTGVGNGIAVPHARLDGLREPSGFLAALRAPIDFAAVDGQPIDLLFLLLLPASAEERGGDAALNALACVARRLRDPQAAAAMRGARDAAALYATACHTGAVSRAGA